jgi:hypothetical protein
MEPLRCVGILASERAVPSLADVRSETWFSEHVRFVEEGVPEGCLHFSGKVEFK